MKRFTLDAANRAYAEEGLMPAYRVFLGETYDVSADTFVRCGCLLGTMAKHAMGEDAARDAYYTDGFGNLTHALDITIAYADGIIQGFDNGHMPTNADIYPYSDDFILGVKDAIAIRDEVFADYDRRMAEQRKQEAA